MPHRRAIDWTLEDFREVLRSGEPENLMLEYKASAAIGDWEPKRRDELAKDLCAFANSAGGVIVIGICEENHKPARLDDGVDTRKASKEAVESALMARVNPRIDNLAIKEIPNTEKPDYSYFVIGVPRSMRAPHMCVPYHRYYKRYNFESVPMEHYEVEDVRRRQTEPMLNLKVELRRGELAAEELLPYTLAIGLVNEGSITAKDVLIRVYVPQSVIGRITWKQNGVALHQETIYNNLKTHRFDVYLRDAAGPIPIFPKDDQPFRIAPTESRKILLRIPPGNNTLFSDQPDFSHPDLTMPVIIQLFAENMRMRQFEFPLRELLQSAK